MEQEVILVAHIQLKYRLLNILGYIVESKSNQNIFG